MHSSMGYAPYADYILLQRVSVNSMPGDHHVAQSPTHQVLVRQEEPAGVGAGGVGAMDQAQLLAMLTPGRSQPLEGQVRLQPSAACVGPSR